MKKLTRREQDVYELILQGRSQKAIAAELGISRRTADEYKARVHEKCGAGNERLSEYLVRTLAARVAELEAKLAILGVQAEDA